MTYTKIQSICQHTFIKTENQLRSKVNQSRHSVTGFFVGHRCSKQETARIFARTGRGIIKASRQSRNRQSITEGRIGMSLGAVADLCQSKMRVYDVDPSRRNVRHALRTRLRHGDNDQTTISIDSPA